MPDQNGRFSEAVLRRSPFRRKHRDSENPQPAARPNPPPSGRPALRLVTEEERKEAERTEAATAEQKAAQEKQQKAARQLEFKAAQVQEDLKRSLPHLIWQCMIRADAGIAQANCAWLSLLAGLPGLTRETLLALMEPYRGQARLITVDNYRNTLKRLLPRIRISDAVGTVESARDKWCAADKRARLKADEFNAKLAELKAKAALGEEGIPTVELFDLFLSLATPPTTAA